MATPPICRNCGAALPRAAMACPRCGHPVFASRRRVRQRRDATVVGMAGALLMCLQSGFMLAGGSVALVALAAASRGEIGNAYAVAGTAAVLVGFTLLFDLFGVLFLALSFYAHAQSLRTGTSRAAVDAPRRTILRQGTAAALCLALWLLLTVAWRAALASLVSFYPTPFTQVKGVSVAEVQRAASVMLSLWVTAAFLLFLGAVFGTRFLLRARGAPLAIRNVLWPLETLVHFGAATAILILGPGLLASASLLDLSSLAAVRTLGAIELLVVPILGLLAYAFLFLEFRQMHEAALVARTPPPPAAAPADPPAGEA